MTDLATVVTDADGIGAATMERLADHGFETAADIDAADHEELVDIRYVSYLRADELQRIAGEEVDERDQQLVDAREVVLDASLGELLRVSFTERSGWVNEMYVVDTDDAVAWRSAAGDDWQTRRIRIADSATSDDRTEWDLVLGVEGVYVTDGPVGDEHWRVGSVGAVGRVQRSTYVQLQVMAAEKTEREKPEGDDTWRQYYQRGEA